MRYISPLFLPKKLLFCKSEITKYDPYHSNLSRYYSYKKNGCNRNYPLAARVYFPEMMYTESIINFSDKVHFEFST